MGNLTNALNFLTQGGASRGKKRTAMPSFFHSGKV
jgi:hypothetical protein